jgi:hypothetical protein
LTYVIPGDEQTELTVYVYPVRPADSAALRGDPRAERDEAVSDVQRYAKDNRQLDEVRVDSQGVFRLQLPDGSSLEAAYAAFLFRRGDSRFASLVYVFVRGRVYVKLRASFPMARAPALGPHITRFLATALAYIREEAPWPPPR